MTEVSAAAEAPSAPANISISTEGGICLITLNRPEARNAISAELTRELAAAVLAVEADPEIRAAILTGSGAHFCAGADLKEVANGGLANLFTSEGGFGGFTHLDRRKPWIAAVEGAAMAGGLELALSCDMIVASRSARFALPEVKRGLMASAGGVYRLPRVLPRPLAFEMIATGEPIDAERAYAVGLVNRLVEPGEAVAGALSLARAVATNAPLAVRESLSIARAALDTDDRTLRVRGDEAQERLERTADFGEGARAFIEKRPPRWTGR